MSPGKQHSFLIMNMENTYPLAGLRESGKNQIFGATVCACVVVPDSEALRRLSDVVVDRADRLSDSALWALDPIIRREARVFCFVPSMSVYNAQVAKMRGDQLAIVGWLYAHALSEAMHTGPVERVSLKKFSRLDTITPALSRLDISAPEEFFIERTGRQMETLVEAASVCARVAYMNQLRALEDCVDSSLCLGYGQDWGDLAQAIYDKYGAAALCRVAREHAPIIRRILGR